MAPRKEPLLANLFWPTCFYLIAAFLCFDIRREAGATPWGQWRTLPGLTGKLPEAIWGKWPLRPPTDLATAGRFLDNPSSAN
ncbi:MAG: hypothetical protein DWH79_04905 [Planctomycetota bacterium]|nr:MAG: hypothetical protein DWH79_04905 [Planctomycetota bacterium]